MPKPLPKPVLGQVLRRVEPTESQPLGLFETLEKQTALLNEEDKLIAELSVALEKLLPPLSMGEAFLTGAASYSESQATAHARTNLETIERQVCALRSLIHRTNAI